MNKLDDSIAPYFKMRLYEYTLLTAIGILISANLIWMHVECPTKVSTMVESNQNTKILYSVQSNPTRVLATITGGWSLRKRWPHWHSTLRKLYVTRQLDRYVHACELGYDISVALVSYAPWNYTDFVNVPTHFCNRIMATINITFHEFRFERVPNGTAGTLMQKHRLIFMQERNNYDLFVSQEDDVAITLEHMKYFLKWSDIFSGTDFLPAFAPIELTPWSRPNNLSGMITSSQVLLDIRMRAFKIYTWRQHTLVTSSVNHNSRVYMLTQKMLLDATKRDEWLNSVKTMQGEFNVYFGHSQWLEPYYRLAIPVQDVVHSLVNHIPANYIGSSQRLNTSGEGASFGHWVKSVAHCLNSNKLNHLQDLIDDEDRESNITYMHAEVCRPCLTQGGFVIVRITRDFSLSQPVSIKFTCRNMSEINWPGDTSRWKENKRWPGDKGRTKNLPMDPTPKSSRLA